MFTLYISLGKYAEYFSMMNFSCSVKLSRYLGAVEKKTYFRIVVVSAPRRVWFSGQLSLNPPPSASLTQNLTVPALLGWRSVLFHLLSKGMHFAVWLLYIGFMAICKVATYRHVYRSEPKEPTQSGSVSVSKIHFQPNFINGVCI